MKIKNKKLIIISVIFLISLGLILIFLENNGNIDILNSNQAENVDQGDGINYTPPTEEEKDAGNSRKQQIIEEEKSEPTTVSASVVITDASQYDNEVEIRAFVSNVIEDGGCTIAFVKNGQEIIKKVPAYADATTTPCITLTVPLSEFPESGTWKVEVIYNNESNTTAGSMTTELEIK